jgi:hypothetical protein
MRGRRRVKHLVPGPVCRVPVAGPKLRLSRAERKALKEKQGSLFEGVK